MNQKASTHPQAAHPAFARPKLIHSLKEARVMIDMVRMIAALSRPASGGNQPQHRQIMVFPGFGGGDASTWPLRRHLQGLGQTAQGWGMGQNLAGSNIRHTQADIPSHWPITPRSRYKGEAGVIMLCEQARQQVIASHATHQSPITLIGWSLGGYVAREVARDLPHIVSHVITLGSPVVGGPKYTTVAPLFRLRGMDLDWIEQASAERDAVPIQAPITAIVSPSDGVVGYQAALDRVSPQVTHISVDAAHIGLGINPRVWALISAALIERDAAGRDGRRVFLPEYKQDPTKPPRLGWQSAAKTRSW